MQRSTIFPLTQYEGKVAVVTGASSGIGAAVASLLIHQGLIVVGIATNEQALRRFAATLGDLRMNFYDYAMSVTNEGAVQQLCELIETTYGKIHILVNCAGIYNNAPLISGNSQDWRAILDVNLMGLCIVTRGVLGRMLVNNIDGYVIIVNCVHGAMLPMPQSMYGPSKHAVKAVAETLRREVTCLQRHVKISSISPGLVDTPMVNLQNNALPYLSPPDVANAVGYMLSTPPNVLISDLIIRPTGDTS